MGIENISLSVDRNLAPCIIRQSGSGHIITAHVLRFISQYLGHPVHCIGIRITFTAHIIKSSISIICRRGLSAQAGIFIVGITDIFGSPQETLLQELFPVGCFDPVLVFIQPCDDIRSLLCRLCPFCCHAFFGDIVKTECTFFVFITID